MSLQTTRLALTFRDTSSPPANKSTKQLICSGNRGKICGNNLETGSVVNIASDSMFSGELVSSGTGDDGKHNNGYAFYGVKEGTLWFVMLENSI